MNDLLQTLLKLQALDFAENTTTSTDSLKAELRARVPQQILGHYDRLVARGKKGIAIVRNQVCTGCHMRIPIGTVNTLMQGTDVQLCDTCGRYLCLAPAEETQKPAQVAVAAEAPAAEAKPARKPRKRKVVANAA
ncbi:MAG TPA: C4-type zinc ribbon domain-containing protein [Bacillota bacterium]|nr:C4-type zinc ribbon domain-containing protein [Bacillota bacterium]